MSDDKKDKKKERKEKKEKRSEADGVKKVKKEKKEKKELSSTTTTALLNEIEKAASVDGDGDITIADAADATAPQGALVPFANPLADEKQTKKVLKGVKKAAKNKTLKRGVKEVVKSLRKSPSNGPASTFANPIGIVVLAADISPMDVISHIPVLCEDHNIPYIYVSSRAELGAAGNTKRPTSVVLLVRERQKKKGEDSEGDEEWKETFDELLKLVQKAGKSVTI